MDFKEQVAKIRHELNVFQDLTECPACACAVCEYVDLCDAISDLNILITKLKNEGKL